MRRALIAIALAAVVAIAGLAAYVYLYEGSLDVAVQDDSGAWADVWVTFTQVWVHEAGKSEDVGWHNLTVAQASIDLASLVNVSELLASARVGPGKYTEIRLVVIAATGRMLDGTNVVFSVPSGDVKAVTPFEIRSGAATRLTVGRRTDAMMQQSNRTGPQNSRIVRRFPDPTVQGIVGSLEAVT